jgi:hypothetical protein
VHRLFYIDAHSAAHDLRHVIDHDLFDQADLISYAPAYAPMFGRTSETFDRPIHTLKLISYHRASPPDSNRLLDSLRYTSLLIEDTSYRGLMWPEKDFFYRTIQESGATLAGPHRALIMPDRTFDAFLSAYLDQFPAMVGPLWHLHCVPPVDPGRYRAPLMVTSDEKAWCIMSPWIGMNPATGLQASRELHTLARRHGGTIAAFLPGLPMTREQWRQSLGSAWEPLQAAKRTFDPRNTLKQFGSSVDEG